MTPKQMRQFWPAFARACDALGLTTSADKSAYRSRIMMEEASANHLAEVSNTHGYEALMARLAADAGDYEDATRYAGGDDRRMAHMVDDCARQVFELSGKAGSDRISYVRAILEQSGLIRQTAVVNAFWWLDYPDTTLDRIFHMLDTHRRRLLHRRSVATGTRLPIRYCFGQKYAS